MQILIKNFRKDRRGMCMGFNCSRIQGDLTRRLGLHQTRLGNEHTIGRCHKCRKTHSRSEAIIVCSEDQDWRNEFIEFEAMLMKHHLKVDTIELWCWCAPLPCHCDVIKDWLLQNPAFT